MKLFGKKFNILLFITSFVKTDTKAQPGLWGPRPYYHTARHPPNAWCHQMETFSALLALCAGNSPVPVNFPHKGQWSGALMFSLIRVWINGWVNNREAGDLRRHRGHYDVNVMECSNTKIGINSRSDERRPVRNCLFVAFNKYLETFISRWLRSYTNDLAGLSGLVCLKNPGSCLWKGLNKLGTELKLGLCTAGQRQATRLYLNQWWLDSRRIYASPSLNDSMIYIWFN